MMNSLETMKEDLILEIMSHCASTEIAKFRLLNKACNKRSYEFFFLSRHLHRANSVFGYFIQSYSRFKYHPSFVSGDVDEEAPEKHIISLEFLPRKDVKIEACDTHHGILLCVDDNRYKGAQRIPDYIVCKPATKQYRIIANPKTRYFTIATGLMVIQSNPFRYKIVRVSEPMAHERKKMKEGFYNLYCEVFDSDCFAWKQLNDLEIPMDKYFVGSEKPVSSYGFLHWLTRENNVIRFCFRTETWSEFLVPEDVVGDGCLDLISYEGKLGVICSNSRQGYDLWVMRNGFGNCWVNVKDVKITGLEDKYAKPLWFPSNDVVSMNGFCRMGLCNLNNKSSYLRMTQHSLPHYLPREICFPFYSNYERVCLNEDRLGRSNKCKRSKAKQIKDWNYLQN